MEVCRINSQQECRVGNWFKPPGLNHGLNRLKLNEFMSLAGINSILPGLNRLKPPAGINQFKPLAGINRISAGFFATQFQDVNYLEFFLDISLRNIF